MRTLIILTVMVFLMLPITALAIQVSGDQWGTWTPDNNPYNVVGEIHVPGESTLVIAPGVIVNFRGHYKFVVDSLATLQAIGAVNDSICFATTDTATGWDGIRFLYANDNSQISYCHLAYGKTIGIGNGGAIYCYNSSPTISHNTIRNNSPGAIYCKNHNGVIEYNNICDNTGAGYGGGILCDGTGPWIRYNTIRRNSSSRGGAGIFCYRNTIIEGNIIENNYTERRAIGVGIHVSYLDNVIKNNTICYNECDYGGYGGGISTDHYGAIITGNYIYRNSAGDINDGSLGGGIYGNPLILENNTIANNHAAGLDGIYFFSASNTTISNCIIRDDFGGSFDITVEYSNIVGNWPGVGNINEDPLFVNPHPIHGDYTLSIESPCIDAGDPESEVPEHGGDRIDMGAFEFFQRFNGFLLFEEYPEIAETGSVISWEVTLENPTPDPQTIDGWIDFSGPFSGTAIKDLNKTLQPGIWTDTVEFLIPEDVPVGIYTVKGRVGIYNEAIWDSEVFDIEIIPGTL